ncbi:molecular chaperone [Mycolicibacterium chubuense NBB4]|uniref:Molecular chaperone n=1 Tax=Mycolicibacterium chubuense (strain NBB4) TaxID=710421 RepID=I4BD61_MYCCN|nr:Hsp70 family protein [Mycolicibacterium chubuense]AFM15218.1 molecular chaperone [Mycolicibacterium chubuense NBB4]
MTEPLGLSIGMTNLVAARVGQAPVIRRSLLTVFPDRPAEVGLPSETQTRHEGGLVLSGFVDRVGDPVPLVAADGSAHRGEVVLAEALDAMARTVGGGSPVAIAVPAHWGPGTIGALRGALRNRPGLAPGGVPPALIPDSRAALAALQAAPGLPDRGVVMLVDLGGSGTSITLADAGANLDAIGQTVRYQEFSGDAVDQALLDHVLAGIADANDADPAGTAAVGSLARLRDECRRAKERLSSQTATVVPADLPGFRSDIRVTRPELEQLTSAPLGGLIGAIEDSLQRNGIAAADVSAVATVGGGAAIPLVTQRLSERLRAPVITTPESALNVAAGAALVANLSLAADAPTGMAPAADAATAMAPAAWAAGAAGLAATESADDGASSATFRALAWSQDDAADADPVPYTGDDYTSPSAYAGATAARPAVAFGPGEGGDGQEPDDLAPLPWYKRPAVLFGVAAAAALLAAGGLVVTLTSAESGQTPVTKTATPSPTEPAAPLPPPVTTVTMGPDGIATTTVSQPPPPPPPPSSAPESTTEVTTTAPTTTPPTTTTTVTTTVPTTTTTVPTTTAPTTTRSRWTWPTRTTPPAPETPTVNPPVITTVPGA